MEGLREGLGMTLMAGPAQSRVRPVAASFTTTLANVPVTSAANHGLVSDYVVMLPGPGAATLTLSSSTPPTMRAEASETL